jgi:uncharacterized protein
VERLLLWRGLDEWRAEAAHIRLDGDRLTAHGTQLGLAPQPYRLDYRVTTGGAFVAERLEVSVLADRGLRRLAPCAIRWAPPASRATW